MFNTKEQCFDFFDSIFKDEPCRHYIKVYQPQEDETNIPESYSCNDCGEEIDIPQENRAV